MTISPEQLQAWKRLADEATSGPWWSSEFESGVYAQTEKGKANNCFDMAIARTNIFGYSVTQRSCESNAAFIAAARTAVPALIAEVERLRHREFSLNLDVAVEGTSKIAHEMENIRLRKQLEKCKEQRNEELEDNCYEPERPFEQARNRMDAELEKIK